LVLAARPRILVADDDVPARTALCHMLRRRFDIVEASDGTDVVARIEAGETFDALLLDLEMPNLDGRQTLERLAVVAPALAARTLVVTGGSCDPALRQWLSELPPGRVHEKPVDVAVLVAAIEALLGP
jgi:CheY-like chemotaxis protein